MTDTDISNTETRRFFVPTNDREILAHRVHDLDCVVADLRRERAIHIALDLHHAGIHIGGRKGRVYRQTAQRLWDLWHDPYDQSLADASAAISAAVPGR